MFYKFPSTPYIDIENSTVRKDKVLTAEEIDKILCKEIYVEEKIDGANLGISFDDAGKLLLQNRGDYLFQPLEGQWRLLYQWISQRENQIFDCISNEYILFGEWCNVKHSVYYNELPDYFLAFDIFDKKEKKFLSVKRRNLLIKKMNIEQVPCLGCGKYDLLELKKFFGKSKFGEEKCEGIYLRQDEGEFLKYRAKMVRKDFRQKIDEHWSKKIVQYNKIVF
jgi:ATP-dependent RNA circularization protein (DNA/RNA ligase family)